MYGRNRKKERRFYSARHDFYAHVRMNERMNEWILLMQYNWIKYIDQL